MKSLLLRMSAAACTAIIVAGCSSEPAAPEGALSLVVAPTARAVQTAAPGITVAAAPAVEVLDPAGAPVPNVYVSFTVTLGDGVVATKLVKSDSHGLANSGSWTLGDVSGPNQVTASLEGGASLAFDAYGITMPTGSDWYDLLSQGGQQIPGTFGSTADPYMVLAGRLALARDATYSSVYVRYHPATHVFTLDLYHGAYSISGAQITLADYPTGTSAVAVIQADLLILHSGDPTVLAQEDVYIRATDTR